MNVFKMGGRGKLQDMALRAGRDTGPGLRKVANAVRIAGAGTHPRGNLRAALRGFRSGQRGATTIVVAIAILVLVTTLAALLGIVHEAYIEDRMARGARAAARAVSLAATAPASEKALKDIVCKAVGGELGEGAGKDCACWSIELEAFETPQALSAGTAREAAGGSHGGENMDMILVRLRRPYGDWLSGPDGTGSDSDIDSDSNSSSDTDPDTEAEADSCPDASDGAEIVVAAVARNEREVRVSQ